MAYTILVVDDEKEIVEVLSSRLQREGYKVSCAYDGQEALEKVKNDNPDIILLDLMLPKLNGFDVLKEIRHKYNDRWRPVIIISAQTDLESIKKGYTLDADHYLSKPCSLEHVLRGIRTMISLMPARHTP